MSSIYSFFAGSHSAACALVVDGEIKHIIEEERLSRIKSGENTQSYPTLSLSVIESQSGLSVKDSDHRLVVLPSPDAYYRKLIKKGYEKFGHHDSHNYGCYFTSGFKEKSLAISYDGGGQNHFLKVFLCEDGKMIEVLNGPMGTFASLPHLWGFSVGNMMKDEFGLDLWHLCKDEGKLVGMAPEGWYDEKIYNVFKSLIHYENLKFYGNPVAWRTRFVVNQMWQLGYFDTLQGRQIYSYNLQKFTEDLFLKFLADLNKLYPEYKKLCLSGGFFANVKLNQKINELDWVDEIFIHPAMGDEGLPLGAAIKKGIELGEITHPFKLENVYFGLSYNDQEIELISRDYDFERFSYDSDDIAKKLHEGKIIGWFQGRFEYGPRALGNRSILVKTTERNAHSELNRRLKRYEIMPFAPSVLEERFDDVFYPHKSLYSAQFMTLCFSTKEEWHEKIPAVLQKTDKSARPHVVNKKANPKYHELLEKYYLLSGIPVILNTSFNKHNDPIIDNPKQAFDCLMEGIIDELVIENYVYRFKS